MTTPLRVASVFIQGPEVWGQPNELVRYREGFADFVRTHGDPGCDRVVLLEPNPRRAAALRESWQGWGRVDVLEVDLGSGQGATREYTWAQEDEPALDYFAPDPAVVRRRFPNGSLRVTQVPRESLPAVLDRVARGYRVALLSLDVRRGLDLDLSAIESAAASIDAVSVTSTAGDGDARRQTDRLLRRAGLRRAGRAWGEAGTGRLYRRPRSAEQAMSVMASQARVTLGEGLVHVRDRWLGQDRRAALQLRARVTLSRRLGRADVLDDAYGQRLPPVPPVDMASLLPAHFGIGRSPWSLEWREPDPFDVAVECAGRHGVWPISFSYPGKPLPVLDAPDDLISPIIPGFAYSFDDEAEYLATYQHAYLGVTHRKAGWDCFRHVEVLAAGAVPLMPDAAQIPGFAMVHYPKRALATVTALVREHGAPPDQQARQAFRIHFERHLTSAAMARYVLRASGLEAAARVLFIDERLPGHADYQSVMSLLGLKQLLGAECHLMFPTDYVYEDTSVPVSTLYGRGFGYTRLLPPESRSTTEAGRSVDLADFDVVVVGSVTRNEGLAFDLLRQFPREQTVWIHGEDTPPLPEQVRKYRKSGAHVFVRAIHTG